MRLSFLYIFLAAFLAVSCTERDCGCAPFYRTEVTFDFEQDLQGWQAGYADLPINYNPTIYELSHEYAQLPPSITSGGKAFKITGHNRSDDLFMFIKKQLNELKPNTTYDVTFTVQLASQYPQNSVGIGGSPGSSVYLKVGATEQEPLPVENNGYYRMNIDIGKQSDSGTDMIVIGTVGIPGSEFKYQLIERNNMSNPVTATTDKFGNLWVIVGTDSGFEGLTTLYYNTIEIKLSEKR